MTFARVAAAIVMFKLLELFWSYAFVTVPESPGKALVVVTIAWLAVSWLLWGLLVILEGAVHKRTHHPTIDEQRADIMRQAKAAGRNER